MIQVAKTLERYGLGWPRTSGDDPACSSLGLLYGLLAPHERG